MRVLSFLGKYGRKVTNTRMVFFTPPIPNGKKRFTCKSLAEVISQKDNYTRNMLNELVEEGRCKRELKDPKKDTSPTNPWVFYVKN